MRLSRCWTLDKTPSTSSVPSASTSPAHDQRMQEWMFQRCLTLRHPLTFITFVHTQHQDVAYTRLAEQLTARRCGPVQSAAPPFTHFHQEMQHSFKSLKRSARTQWPLTHPHHELPNQCLPSVTRQTCGVNSHQGSVFLCQKTRNIVFLSYQWHWCHWQELPK